MKIFLFLILILYSSKLIASDIVDLDNYYLRNFNIKKEKINNKKIKIAVLDTGLNINHKKYKDRLIVDERFKKTHKYTIDIPIDLIPFEDEREDHSSHIVGIITSISKNSLILPLRVYDKSLSESQKAKKTVKAIEFCIKEKVDIINYSISNGLFNYDEKQALIRAKKAGIFVIVSSGNESIQMKKNSFPAFYRLDNIFVISGRSNQSHIGNYDKEIVETNLPYHLFSTANNGYKRMKGTSMSTAFFTGLLSRILSIRKVSYKNIRKRITKFTVKKESWKDVNRTNGYLDIVSFLNNKNKKIEKRKDKIKKIDKMIEKLSIKYHPITLR